MAPVIVLTLLSLLTGHAASLEASLDRPTIMVHEAATLSLKFPEGDPDRSFPLPSVPGLQFEFGGSSRQMSLGGGRNAVERILEYRVRPSRPGHYVIPAIWVTIAGQRVSSQPLSLHVLESKSEPPVPSQIGKRAFLQMTIPRTEVFVGEVVPVDLRLHVLRGEGRIRAVPKMEHAGFTAGELQTFQARRERLGELDYVVKPFQTYVIPAKAGQLKLGPVTVPVSVRGPQSRVDFLGEWVNLSDITLTAAALDVRVLPLPEEDVPNDFNGAVGRFTLETSVSTNAVAAGDPITLVARISGQGQIDALQINCWDQWEGFRLYPPTTRKEFGARQGIEGSKIIEQVVVPESVAVREIPPVTFGYFDPELRRYRTLSRPATPLTVRPSLRGNSGLWAGADSERQNGSPPMIEDIVHIKTRPGVPMAMTPPLLHTNGFLALQLIPISAWLGALLWRRRREALAENPRLRRHLRVQREVKNGLKSLPALAANGEAEAFFALTSRLLQEMLGDKLDLPASAITEAATEKAAVREHLSPEDVARLADLFQACNQARYAPAQSAQNLAALIPEVEAVLTALHAWRITDE